MLTTKKLAVLCMLAALILSGQAFAQEATRITFIHSEASSWSDTWETEGYIVEWNMTTAVAVSFPVDVDAYNNGTIDPPSTDQVCFKLSTPEYEGEVNITVSGYVNVTAKGIIPLTGYTEFQNTTSIPVTTPLGEWNISFPIPVSIGVGISITVTVIPTLYVNASVSADVALTGPAIAFTPPLTWKTDGAIENVTVIPVDAELGDEIVVSAENFTYNWNASLTVELKLEGIHLITSPAYWFETPSLQADGDVAVSFNIQVIPDLTPPTTVHDYDSLWHTTDFTITLTATDDRSGVAETYYKINDGPTKTVSADGQPLITTESDNNKLEYWSVDNAGNEESHNILTGIKLDKTAPTGSIIINNDATYSTSTSVTLTLTSSDATSGVYQVRYSNDGVWDTEPWEAFTPTKAWILTSGDGTKTVYYQIKDVAGLVSITYSDTIILDTVPPTGSIIINDGATYTNTPSVTLTLSASDATSGIAEMRFSNDNTTYIEWQTYITSMSWTLQDGDGAKTVYVQFRDQAGLISTYSDTITLDTTPPTGSVTIAEGAAYTNSSSATLTLLATDATSGVAQMRFSNDNVTWSGWEPYATSKSWTLKFGDGPKTIYVQYRDNAGLISSYGDSIILDTTKPTANAGADQTVNEDTSVTLDASASTDERGIATYTWTFTDITPQTLSDKNPTYTFTTLGAYTITLKVTDPAGNTATDTVIITVLDITKPVANAGSDRTVNEDSPTTLDGSASSDNVAITAYTWTFTDVTIKTLTGEKPTYTFSTPGVYTITLNATDAAGNWATDTIVITVLDITKPTANAGQDRTVNVGATVNFDAGASTDNVGIVSYEWDFGDGTTGTGKTATHTYTGTGTHTVILTVKDAAGNTATHSITVTVEAPPAEAFPTWVVGAAAAIAAIGIAVTTILWKRRK